MTERQIRLFWEKVRKTETCWWWIAAVGWNGYGLFGRPTRRAHLVAIELAGVILKPGELGLHKCNNPRCVRYHPEHVYVGDASQNAQDAWNSGSYNREEYAKRMRENPLQQDNPHVGFSPESLQAISLGVRGELNGEAKLTEKQVIMIRNRYKEGLVGRTRRSSVTIQMLADEFGISYTQAKRIIHNQAWRHL